MCTFLAGVQLLHQRDIQFTSSSTIHVRNTKQPLVHTHRRANRPKCVCTPPLPTPRPIHFKIAQWAGGGMPMNRQMCEVLVRGGGGMNPHQSLCATKKLNGGEWANLALFSLNGSAGKQMPYVGTHCAYRQHGALRLLCKVLIST